MRLYELLLIYFDPLFHEALSINGRDHNLTKVTLFFEESNEDGTYYEGMANCSPAFASSVASELLFSSNDSVAWFKEDSQNGELVVFLGDNPEKINKWWFPKARFKNPNCVIKL